MNKLKKQEKGITLIALVVTIIVLLILAGVAISLTIGNNGLFTRAENAANTWRKAEANEDQEMKNFESLYDETVKNLGLGGNGDGKENPLTKITGNETKNTDTTDREGNRIVEPAGFKVINSEATVNEGIVIEDVSANNSDTVGNQFVWIPCSLDGANGSLKYDRYAFSRDDWDYRQIKLNEKDTDGSYKIVNQKDELCDIQDLEHEEEEEAISVNEIGKDLISNEELVPEPEEPVDSEEDIDEEDEFDNSLDDIDYPGEEMEEADKKAIEENTK